FASPFTFTSRSRRFAQAFHPGPNVDQIGGVPGQFEVISFGDLADNVHNVRHAAATLAALAQFAVDQGRHDELPGIVIENGDDDTLDVLGRYQIALADKHGAVEVRDGSFSCPIHTGLKLIVNVSFVFALHSPVSPGSSGLSRFQTIKKV